MAPSTPARITAGAVGIEAVALVGYALSIVAVAATQGLSGPADVSSSAGVVVEVAVFGTLGLGLAWVAVGRWRQQAWATVPFFLAQVFALVVGIPLATGSGGGVPAGIVISLAAVIGLAALLVGALRTGDAVDVRAGTEPHLSRDAQADDRGIRHRSGPRDD